MLIENDPHQLIEGVLIAGLAVDAHAGYIYIRGEYRYLIEIMENAIAEAYAKGWLGKNIQGTGFDFDLYAHTGAGAYECGEESALLESLEGKRGIPRIRPPFPAVVGAFQCPTVLNNVETYCAVPAIIRDGGAAFAALGRPQGRRHQDDLPHRTRQQARRVRTAAGLPGEADDRGSGRRHSVGPEAEGIHSGRIVMPGADGRGSAKAPPWITIPWRQRKTMLGSGGVIVMDDHTCMVKAALRIMRFYAHESCGWCIPCREGTTWLKKILERFHQGGGTRSDIDLIGDIAKNMLGRTFCPLGDAAAMPTISIVEKFRHEFEDHLNGKPCPYEHEMVTA